MKRSDKPNRATLESKESTFAVRMCFSGSMVVYVRAADENEAERRAAGKFSGTDPDSLVSAIGESWASTIVRVC